MRIPAGIDSGSGTFVYFHRKPRAPHALELLFETVAIVAALAVEIAGEALETTLRLEAGVELRDLLDRDSARGGNERRPVRAEAFFELAIGRIDRFGEMPRRAGRDSAADAPSLEQGHAFTGELEQQRCRDAGDAPADHRDVHGQIGSVESRVAGRVLDRPDRFRHYYSESEGFRGAPGARRSSRSSPRRGSPGRSGRCG